MDKPTAVDWQTSSYSIRKTPTNCVRIGTPDTSEGTRFLGDSMNPDAGALRVPGGELAALLRSAAA